LLVAFDSGRGFFARESPITDQEEQFVLDNFRKSNIPQGTRTQSPYSRLQEALTPPSADPGKPDAFKIDVPAANPQAQREEIKGPRADDATRSKLIVGPDIKLKGVEITDCDTLIVEGRVEASMDSRVIQISESGVFSGRAGIDVAEIRGCFEGELTARKQLLVCATGKLSGKIRYGRLAVEEGGEISGDIAALTEAPGKSGSRTDAARGPGQPSALPALTRPGS
jgi:cytoskeletal protein CcmA (bactofilin family)